MSDPFRLRVLKALCATLKEITPVNGYHSDLSDFTDTDGVVSERIIRGRDRFGEGDALPFISVLEDFRPNEQKQSNGGQTSATNEWKLLVQGFVQDDPIHKTDPAYRLAADVVRCLAKQKKDKYNILGLGNSSPCVYALKMDHPVIRPADGEISSVAFFFLNVTLTLVEDLENPFA